MVPQYFDIDAICPSSRRNHQVSYSNKQIKFQYIPGRIKFPGHFRDGTYQTITVIKVHSSIDTVVWVRENHNYNNVTDVGRRLTCCREFPPSVVLSAGTPDGCTGPAYRPTGRGGASRPGGADSTLPTSHTRGHLGQRTRRFQNFRKSTAPIWKTGTIE